jgi:hypothetical protein
MLERRVEVISWINSRGHEKTFQEVLVDEQEIITVDKGPHQVSRGCLAGLVGK